MVELFLWVFVGWLAVRLIYWWATGDALFPGEGDDD